MLPGVTPILHGPPASAPPSGYACDAIVANGDFLRTPDDNILSDSKAGLLYTPIRFMGGNNSTQVLLRAGGPRFVIERTSGNKIRIQGRNAGNSTILDMSSTTSLVSGGGFVNLLASWNLATGFGKIYLGDTDDTVAGATLTDDTIDYSRPQYGVLAEDDVGGSNKVNAELGDFFFTTAGWLDITVEANRRLFFDGSGKPVDPAAAIALLTPQLFFHIDDGETADNWGDNEGTAGDIFTLSGGFTTAAASPTD